MILISLTAHAGVYISHNGVFIEHDSSIFITDIGILRVSSPQRLVCNTDRTPCCVDPNVAGNWLYPSGGIVEHVSNVRDFVRDRSANGEINLYRRNSDTISPTGRFCCRVPDVSDVEQTVCVNVGE